MPSGYALLALGVTSTAIVNMTVGTKKLDVPPKSFIVVHLVCTFLLVSQM